MDLFGTHQVSFSQVRELVIKCYALDLAAYPLLLDSTHDDKYSKTKSAYEELFTAELLALAIAVRTKFYQGLDPTPSAAFISPCGFLYKYGKKGEASDVFTVKDVCDKVIHASSVHKYLEPGIEKPTTTLKGVKNGVKWQLSFSVSLFLEGLLNWLDSFGEA